MEALEPKVLRYHKVLQTVLLEVHKIWKEIHVPDRAQPVTAQDFLQAQGGPPGGQGRLGFPQAVTPFIQALGAQNVPQER